MTTAPSLVHDLTTRDSSETRTPCTFSVIQQAMTPEESEALNNAMTLIKEDRGVGRAKVYSYEWLSDVLTKHGHQISTSTIGRHARGKCGCQ